MPDQEIRRNGPTESMVAEKWPQRNEKWLKSRIGAVHARRLELVWIGPTNLQPFPLSALKASRNRKGYVFKLN